jgi:hypothetical protein
LLPSNFNELQLGAATARDTTATWLGKQTSRRPGLWSAGLLQHLAKRISKSGKEKAACSSDGDVAVMGE